MRSFDHGSCEFLHARKADCRSDLKLDLCEPVVEARVQELFSGKA